MPPVKKAVAVDEPVYKPTSAHIKAGGNDSQSTANISLPNPSADMLQASYDDGYAKGFAEGNAALHQQSVKELQSIIDGISLSASDYRNEALEQEVLAMSLKIAGLLVRHGIDVDKNALYQLVCLGLEQLPSMTSDAKRVHLHPLDANVVRELLEHNANVQVKDDIALERGQCRIESGASVVHAGIDDWLNSLAKQLGLLGSMAAVPVSGTDTY
jgi:flagellar biosynthesis/type III secretory pathway protein FliH